MTRRDELAQVRGRAANVLLIRRDLPAHVQELLAHGSRDRRFLLGLVDELAAALRMAIDLDTLTVGNFDRRYPRFDSADGTPWIDEWRGLLSDLGPDA